MEIRPLNKNEINLLYTFNQKVFPKRKNHKKIIDFWHTKSQDEIQLTIIACDNKTIYGQVLYSSMSYFYNKKRESSVWGFDLIIQKEKRKDAYGLDLMQYALDNFKSSFATGSGPLALKINLALGSKKIGEIRKYIKIVNPIYFISSVIRGKIAIKKFPKLISSKLNKYEKVDFNNLPNHNYPYNENLLEIGRDKDFIQWRFFNHLHDYAVYKNVNSENYFVLRTIVKQYVTMMVLVDFRCNLSNTDEFHDILNIVKKIMNKLHLSILITGSSLNSLDTILEKHHFKTIGYDRPIISTISFKERNEEIINRNFIFVTLADSDGEILW